jgi:hypothetical protein
MKVSIEIYAPTTLSLGKWPSSSHWTEGWVGPRVSLDAVEKIKKSVTAAVDRTQIPWFFSLPVYGLVTLPTELSICELVHHFVHAEVKRPDSESVSMSHWCRQLTVWQSMCKVMPNAPTQIVSSQHRFFPARLPQMEADQYLLLRIRIHGILPPSVYTTWSGE